LDDGRYIADEYLDSTSSEVKAWIDASDSEGNEDAVAA
jgi:hypothetical protein